MSVNQNATAVKLVAPCRIFVPPGADVERREPCVADLVLEAARSRPESIALCSGADAITFAELVDQSSRLASYLIALGAGPEIPVALALERSFDFVISALAVLMAGGAYLPLDTAWPKGRAAAILKDAQAPFLISRGALAREIAQPETHFIDLDADAGRIRSMPLQAHPAKVRGDRLAYIIYTSGSTGAPKGVEVTHANLLNLIFWHRSAFEITNADRASQVAGVGFDAAVWEMWPHLAAGATLVLVDEETRTSPHRLRTWLLENGITVAFIPTVLAEPMIEQPWPRETALRYLLTGGDVLHRHPLSGLPFQVVNNYGPTECTVVATSGCVPAGETNESPSRPSIGSPIANTQIRILDENGRAAADGKVGEIYIAGAGVARGYRNNAQATAERFVPDSASEVPGARMYRTGDLGCWLADGKISFRGRVDNQVQIQGYRVEPDEVVCALNRHPAVARSAVIARSQGCSNGCAQMLVAYIVERGPNSPTASALREFLTAILPHYMTPSTFVRISELPLTANGKLDRDALPAPTAENCLAAAGYRPPSTPTEETLVQILADLVGLDRVGVDDNFFLLGFHSLLATQVSVRVYERFGIQLSLRHLFEAQTIARLAAELDQRLIEKLNSLSDEEVARYLAG